MNHLDGHRPDDDGEMTESDIDEFLRFLDFIGFTVPPMTAEELDQGWQAVLDASAAGPLAPMKHSRFLGRHASGLRMCQSPRYRARS